MEEHRKRIKELESELIKAEDQRRLQIEAAAEEAARRVAAKEQECLNTISSAYGAQLACIFLIEYIPIIGCHGCFDNYLFLL